MLLGEMIQQLAPRELVFRIWYYNIPVLHPGICLEEAARAGPDVTIYGNAASKPGH